MLNIPNTFYRTSVKALILNKKGEFLLCKQSDEMWELPGGGLDFEESVEECIARELKEEMGLKVTKIHPNPAYFFKFVSTTDINFINILFETKVEDLNFTPSDECQEIGFFNQDSASNLDLYGNVKIFCRLFEQKT